MLNQLITFNFEAGPAPPSTSPTTYSLASRILPSGLDEQGKARAFNSADVDKTSCPGDSGWIKPNALFGLNH